jgi:hypothetical protein
LDQQGLPARHCIQLVAGTQRRARAPPVDYGDSLRCSGPGRGQFDALKCIQRCAL